jgi:uncharacterized damage-inducible protein DinB
MGRAAVETLAYLLDEAFEGNEEHSLLGNLTHVTPEDWLARPVEGGRTIRAIAKHAGIVKHLYWEHLFGPARLSYGDISALSPPDAERADIEGMKAWMRDGHRKFRDGVLALTDDQLAEPRQNHAGEAGDTRWIIGTVIQHDVYHAGEINHLRAQRQGDDRWPGQVTP